MCGIGGYSGNFDPILLERMNGSMRHRGPDGEGRVVFGEAGVGLCHCRLAIIDLSPTGAQPMEDGAGQVWISFNGEIYNFRDLRRDLEARGHRFRSKSDTEVLIRLYLEFGTDMLSRLNGIFAFALWDVEKKELFLARDQLGVKPLYYATPPPGFVFASEARALLHEPSLERAIDREALTRQLVFLWTPGSQTLLRGIRRLEPGCAMVVRDGKIARAWRYYDLPQPGHSLFRSDAEAVEATRESVRQAVHRQMVADVPVAALLSGGLDSSGVVAFAKEVAPDGHVACFTAAMDGEAMREEGFVDDLPYARRVAEHLDVPLHEVPISSDDFLSAQGFMAQADFPIVDPAAFNTYYLAQAARRAGYKVVLTGAGGDDVFSGYRRHLATELEPVFREMPRSARTAIESITRHLPTNQPLLRRMRKLFDGAGSGVDGRLISRFHWIDPTTANRLTGYGGDVDAPLHEALQRFEGEFNPLERTLILEKLFFLADHNLLYMDQMGMEASIEIRVPLIDIDVVDMAARIPSGLKQRWGATKRILKKAMSTVLPQDVINRPKTGFGAPLRSWLAGPMKQEIEAVLSPGPLKSAGLVDPDVASHLLDGQLPEAGDATYTAFALYAIHRWSAANGIR